MAGFDTRLKELRISKNLSQKKLSEELNVSKSSINMYEHGSRRPDFDTLEKIADYFNVNIDYLLGKSDIPDKTDIKKMPEGMYRYNPTHKIPILGKISAGLPLYAEEQLEGYTYTELNSGYEYFALRVRGDSMNAARMQDGDIIIVRRQNTVDDGQIAVVLVDNEDATVKRFYKNGSVVTLQPQSTNPVHRPQIYDLTKTNILILGLVVEIKITSLI